MLNREAVKMSICGLYVGIDRTQTGLRKRLGYSASRQRTGCAGLDRNRRRSVPGRLCADWGHLSSASRNNRDHPIVWRILNHIIGNVAEVAFVRNSVSAANRPFAVTEWVISETNTRRKILEVPLRQPTRGTVGSGQHQAISDSREKVAAGAEEEVGFDVRIGVVLHAVIFPAHTEIEGEFGGCFPVVLRIDGSIIKAIVAFKDGRRDRRRQGAGRRHNRGSGLHVFQTRELALGENGTL